MLIPFFRPHPCERECKSSNYFYSNNYLNNLFFKKISLGLPRLTFYLSLVSERDAKIRSFADNHMLTHEKSAIIFRFFIEGLKTKGLE
jgi:hypothetical protein